MAKTIGKDKGTATSARLSAEAGAAGATANDESSEELLVSATDDELGSASSAAEIEAEGGDEDLALPASRAVARRSVAEPAPQKGQRVREAMAKTALTRYLYESALELTKVTRPTRQEAWNMTVLVIVMSAIIAAILGLADVGLIRALSWIVSGH